MGNIWAVARYTIAESIRMKVALFFIILLAVLLLGLPFTSEGDATLSGAVQSFLSYSVTATSFLLSCLTIFMVKSLSSDLTGKHILMLMTKPLSRWQYVLGKWFGIVLFNALLLSLSGLVIYGMTHYLANGKPRDKFDEERLSNQVLKARHSAYFKIPDFTREANIKYEESLEQGLYADSIDFDEEVEKERLRTEFEKRWRTIWPTESREFVFEDVRCDRSEGNTIQIQYQARVYNYPADEVLRCYWVAGDTIIPRADVVDRKHTVSIPAKAVGDDGTLKVGFFNVDYTVPEGYAQHPATAVFEGNDSVQVLFSVSTFGSNLVRALSLVMCRLTFLAAIAIAAATIFSFPVAVLVALVVYIIAASRGFIIGSTDWLVDEGFPRFVQAAIEIFLQALYFVIPDFSKFNGLENLVDGRNVPLMWVIQGFGNLVFIKTAILMLIACLLFQRRQVSEISV